MNTNTLVEEIVRLTRNGYTVAGAVAEALDVGAEVAKGIASVAENLDESEQLDALREALSQYLHRAKAPRGGGITMNEKTQLTIQRAREYRASGMSHEEACIRAAREVGGHKEASEPKPGWRQLSERAAELRQSKSLTLEASLLAASAEARAREKAHQVLSDALFLPVASRFSETAAARTWIPYLPVPGSYESPKYGTILITPERSERFIKNFKAGVYQKYLPIDAEHDLKTSGALGHISDMRRNSDGSVDAYVTWTDRGREMVKADRFKYISPEWYDEWEDPMTRRRYQDVAIGAGLTTRPFFKERALRPLAS